MPTGRLGTPEATDVIPCHPVMPVPGLLTCRLRHRGPRRRGAVFGPEDVVEGGRLGSVFAEAGEALSAMVLAVHEDLGESLGDGGLGSQGGQVESPLEAGLGQVGDEGQQLFGGGAVELDQLVEFGSLGFPFLVEWAGVEAMEDDALRRHKVV